MGGISFRRLLASLLLAVWTLAAAAASPQSATQVLLLNSYSPGRPGFDTVIQAFIRRLHEGGIPLENIHAEFLHLNQSNAELVAPARRTLLLEQYGGQRIDVVVALQQPALNFILDELPDLAPQAPLLTDSEPSMRQLADTRRAIFKYAVLPAVGATMQDVMRLLPHTRRVVIPAGVAEADRLFQHQAEVALAPWLRQVQVEFLHNMSWGEQLRYISSLTPDTVVVAGIFNRDRDGYTIASYDAMRDMLERANVPVFGLFDIMVGEGAVGGAVRVLAQSGIELADHAQAIAAGRLAAKGAVTEVAVGPVRRLYDARQLERWHIDPSPLENATILFRPPSLWQAYRGTVLGTGAVFLLLAGLLALSLVQRRRLAQAVLASRENGEHCVERGAVDAASPAPGPRSAPAPADLASLKRHGQHE